MEVFLFAPAGAGPHPGLVLCQHIPVGHTGIENDTVTLETAERFCANGYTVAVPFIFHWWPKSADIEVKRAGFRDDWTRLDLDAAYERLAAQPDVDRERIGIAGHCWGGRVAWLGVHQPALQGLRGVLRRARQARHGRRQPPGDRARGQHPMWTTTTLH